MRKAKIIITEEQIREYVQDKVQESQPWADVEVHDIFVQHDPRGVVVVMTSDIWAQQPPGAEAPYVNLEPSE